MAPIITAFFATLECGERRQLETVAVLPIFSTASAGQDYLTLSEAMAARTLTISEVDAQGTVPELYAKNSGALPVLLLDGEEVTGVNQNRAMNTTMLLPAHARTRIPVSCTEHGRWRRQSAVARTSGNVLPHRLRGYHLRCRGLRQRASPAGRGGRRLGAGTGRRDYSPLGALVTGGDAGEGVRESRRSDGEQSTARGMELRPR